MLNFYKHFNLFIILLIIGICSGILGAGCMIGDGDGDGDSDILPNITYSVTSLDFGQINVESFSIKTVTIENSTSGNVVIERVTSTYEDVFPVGGYYTGGRLIWLEVPFMFERNESRILYVGFYPDEAKVYEASLVVESRIETSSTIKRDLLEITGTGLPDPD